MTLLLLGSFIIIETVFAVLAMRTDITKKNWTVKRLAVCAAELLLYLIMLLLPGIDAGFRFKGLIIMLITRIICAGIFVLINRNKKDLKKKAMMVTGAVGGSVMIAASLIPAAVFADYHGLPVTGRYSVATDEAILIDRSRLETFENDGSYREIPVHFYYPEEATEEDSDTMPLIVFSHGAFGYYQSNTSTYMELASHGYVVVSLDHPYHSFYTRDTDGKTVIVDSDFLRTVMEINDSDMSEAEVYDITSGWMEIREADMNYVIDEITRAKSGEMDDTWFFGDSNEGITKAVSLIDIEKIGLIGHSLGGATSVTVGRRDDVSAVVDLDGTMLGEETGVADGVVIINDEPYETPLLAIEKEDHHAQRVEAERIGYVYSNNVILDNAREGYSTYFAGSEHMDFTDLPMFSPFLAGMLGKGSVDPEECMTEVNQIVLEFFDCYLKGEGEFSVNEYY